MAVIDLGAGKTATQTTRTVAASDSPEIEVLGEIDDPRAVFATDETSVIALLKAVFDQQQETHAALLRELGRIRYGLQLLLLHKNIDINLETV